MKRMLIVGIGLVSVMGLNTAVAQPGRHGAFGREGHGPGGHGPHGSGPGPMALDVDSNGFVSLAEFLAPAEEHFAELDTDDDDLVTLVEFRVPAETRFGELDTNGDGSLTSDELRPPRPTDANGARGERRPPWTGKHQGGLGKGMLDTDGDGLVSPVEFLAPAEAHFAELDADDDDLVTLVEFRVPAETRFSELDADGDGQVSEDEFRAHRRPPRGMRDGRRPNGASGTR